MKLYVKGKSVGNVAWLAFSADGKIVFKQFDEVFSTKGGKIRIAQAKGMYQAELYAIIWGMTLTHDEDRVELFTNSLVITAMVRYILSDYFDIAMMDEPYKDLASALLITVERKRLKVNVNQVDIGKSTIMNKLRDKLIEYG